MRPSATSSAGLESISLSEQQIIQELQNTKNKKTSKPKLLNLGSDEKMNDSESSENNPAMYYNESHIKNETLRI